MFESAKLTDVLAELGITKVNRILLDVDGCFADWLGYLLKTANIDIPIDAFIEWDVFKKFTRTQLDTIYAIMARKDWWVRQPVLPGAGDAFRYFKEISESIIWATSPYLLCPDWEHGRRGWIYKHFNGRDEHVIVGAAKEILQGDILVEDKPGDRIEGWLTNNKAGLVLMPDHPYNRNYNPSNPEQKARLFHVTFTENGVMVL